MRTLSLRCGPIVLWFGTMALMACKPSGSPPTGTAAAQTAVYNMRGVIERLGTDQAPRQLIIRHESTKDMDSMAMPFFIDDPVPMTGLALGDKVSFRFEIDPNSHAEHVTRLDKLPTDTPLNLPGSTTAATAPAFGTMKGMPGR